ncbi:hypothetical protein [Streptomyces acidiscabies]|uniref:Uncharacterized protein n=1 Tax=Streptomyces acidiscabies TaxID=42234 RepID=A0AAP6B6R3_9ACTN|nr:hypothetical protein [Streptomyces acidiscabies]MBP5939848.1 hypothetical protein [Streptomyces sp. LBUM 1476]MBZ3911033.1 hypothetical protein [Streptomyces acidiscabies]MDX2959186.1 hypothetical protein [Streptomyces acidiscabies]MDX3017670.1 hypothetical protein [Streptomyces acidiscabies]MDX3788145.1 hypothetical protein [Streptomyces acidiscabies]
MNRRLLAVAYLTVLVALAWGIADAGGTSRLSPDSVSHKDGRRHEPGYPRAAPPAPAQGRSALSPSGSAPQPWA